MSKIYRYELRRTVLSKSFCVMLLICLFFAWSLLSTVTVRGVAHTAPFSCRSFADYYLRMLPLTLASLALLRFNQRRGSAKRLLPITNASPTPPRLLQKARMSVIWTAWLLFGLFITLLGLGFLSALFREAVPLGNLPLIACAVFLPWPALWLLFSLCAEKARK